MSFPDYCPPALTKKVSVKAEKPVDKIQPVKIVCAGKKVDKNPYREMKERMDAAEKLVDEMSNKEESYKMAAKEALRQLLNLRSRLNETIAWVRSHCVQGEVLQKPRAEPIVIEDECMEEKPVDKNEAEKSVDKNNNEVDPNEELFGDEKPVDKNNEEFHFEYHCIATLKNMMKTAKDEYAKDPLTCSTFDFVMRYDDDLWKVSYYMEHGNVKSREEIDRYFIESKPGWLDGDYKSFWDFYCQVSDGYDKCVCEFCQNPNFEPEQNFEGSDILPEETQV